LAQATQYFIDHGSSMAQAQKQAFGWIAQQVEVQVTYLAYSDVFFTLMSVSAAAVPLALILRNVKPGAAAVGH
jgi:DHA2 family multidrug resistance protein